MQIPKVAVCKFSKYLFENCTHTGTIEILNNCKLEFLKCLLHPQNETTFFTVTEGGAKIHLRDSVCIGSEFLMARVEVDIESENSVYNSLEPFISV